MNEVFSPSAALWAPTYLQTYITAMQGYVPGVPAGDTFFAHATARQQADAGIPAVSSNTNREEALSALVVLGYQTKSCVKILDELLSMDSEMSVERLIRNALNKL